MKEKHHGIIKFIMGPAMNQFIIMLPALTIAFQLLFESHLQDQHSRNGSMQRFIRPYLHHHTPMSAMPISYLCPPSTPPYLINFPHTIPMYTHFSYPRVPSILFKPINTHFSMATSPYPYSYPFFSCPLRHLSHYRVSQTIP